jgi:isopentenyl-diphosphate delta-isomerase
MPRNILVTKAVSNQDQVVLVDENDQILGSLDKLEAHREDGLLHQAVSLFIFRKNQAGNLELLLQKRSSSKIVGANQWANTLCGNLRPGESHQQCVLRRSREELGLSWSEEWPLEEVFVLRYQVKCNQEYSENEIDHIFFSFLDEKNLKNFSLDLNPAEVAETSWLDWQLVKTENFENLANKEEKVKIAPWFKIFLDNKELISKLDESF